jgi:hypothetical protein
MKLTICGNEFVFIVMGVFSSFRTHILKINSYGSSRNHYLWIINIQKAGQIYPKRMHVINLPMRGSALFAPYYLLRILPFQIVMTVAPVVSQSEAESVTMHCGNYANW